MAYKYTKGSFIVVPNIHALSGLDPATQCVFVWICSYADKNGQCFPTKKTLSKDVGVSLKTLERHIEKLIAVGLLTKEARFVKNRQTSNTYQIMILERGEGGKNDAPPSVKMGEGEGGKNDAQNSTHRELNSNNSTAEETSAGSGADINKMIDAFKDVNPSFTRLYAQKPQREACRRLIKQYTLEKCLAMVAYLPKSNASRFAPTITTPYELEKNLGKLIAFAQKQKDFSHKGKEIIV